MAEIEENDIISKEIHTDSFDFDLYDEKFKGFCIFNNIELFSQLAVKFFSKLIQKLAMSFSVKN